MSDGAIFDYSRFMDVRNGDVIIPANDYRRFKLMVEHELDDRESPLRELIRSQGDGKKDQQRRDHADPSAPLPDRRGRSVASRREGGSKQSRASLLPADRLSSRA